jgi:histidine decarboxylase
VREREIHNLDCIKEKTMPGQDSMTCTPLQRLQQFKDQLLAAYTHFIGFPAALDYDCTALMPLFHCFLNNIGDPYVDPLLACHSKGMEREVIDFFANVFRAPQEDRWGYVTTGGTEGNLYALYVARELYRDAVVYSSVATHYSVQKNLHVLNMPHVQVPAQPTGELDYDALRRAFTQHRHRPAIIVANIGTTMTEAKDNVATIKRLLNDLAIHDHFIHSDAAFAGVPTALIEPHHPFDFADGADSITVSGRKFIGVPMACGIVIVRNSHKDRIGRMIAFTGAPDTTLSGSRNGHTPILLWYAIQQWGLEGFRHRTHTSLQLATYAHEQLQHIGWETWRNPNALTVMLAAPAAELITKWQLATADGWSHIICLPGMTRAHIDTFLADLVQSRRRNLHRNVHRTQRSSAQVGV